MSASSGEKRRRRRERRFLQVNDTLSLRSTIVAVAATVLMLVVIGRIARNALRAELSAAAARAASDELAGPRA